MARDPGLEELLREILADRPGLREASMFGGLCWMLHGNLLCGARDDGLLVRLGKGQDGWALEHPAIRPMVSGKRQMQGWVRVGVDAYGDDDLRQRLIEAAVAFVTTLPAK